jgi:3',5'-cyclic-AMP phosphodiesterase
LAQYLIIQISDVHLTTEGSLRPGIHPRENLVAGLAKLAESGLQPDLFILTGDLADTGEPSCYEDLASLVGAAASPAGAMVIYLPGNHDRRPSFARHLLGQESGLSPVNQVHWLGGLRIVSLDSLVPDHEYGLLADETLEFLRSALVDPAPDGTVLAVHHPPLPSPIEPMSRIRLREPERLADAIDGADVRMILCGHNHHEGFGMLGSTPVWISPSAAYRLDVTSRTAFRALPGGAFTQVDLDEPGASATVIPIPPRES